MCIRDRQKKQSWDRLLNPTGSKSRQRRRSALGEAAAGEAAAWEAASQLGDAANQHRHTKVCKSLFVVTGPPLPLTARVHTTPQYE
eukprot:6762116-Pyramimonas_sp.AAC.1